MRFNGQKASGTVRCNVVHTYFLTYFLLTNNKPYGERYAFFLSKSPAHKAAPLTTAHLQKAFTPSIPAAAHGSVT
jgi:hypothetical protein